MSEPTFGASGSMFAIATPHMAATAAGVAAFDAGGNAVDAALAAATTLAVAAPHMCGVGGDLFALVHEPSGRIVAVNASGAAPAAVDVDALRREGAMPEHGPHAVTVPGAVSGWWELAARWGRFGLPAALAPAIDLARGGVAVSRTLAADLQEAASRLLVDPGAVGVFAPAGRPLARGEALVQPALATTLEALAEEGPVALYGGTLGEVIARHLRALGSAMSPEDLAAHEAWSGLPLTLGYRGLEVHVVPPNSQGFVLLQILALVERLGLDPDPTGPDAGTLAEVFRITAAERDRANADPRRVDVPVELLLGDARLDELADAVRRGEGPPDAGWGSDTVALVAADASGLGVVLIQSLFDAFGSGILEPATGVLLHCRGAAFVLESGHPNVLAGGKRPSHTLLPVVVQRGGGLAALAGTMGGGGQPQIDAMTLLRAFDLGLPAAEAVAAPRWLVGGMALGSTDRRVVAEASVPAAARRALEDAGYAIDVVPDLGRSVGHAHLLLAHDGGFDVGSDPRADGAVGVR